MLNAQIRIDRRRFWSVLLLKVLVVVLAFIAGWELIEHLILNLKVDPEIRILHLLRGIAAAGIVVLLFVFFFTRRSGFEQEMLAICELLKNAKEGLIALDGSFRVIAVNFRATELLGSTFSGNFTAWLQQLKDLLPAKSQFEIPAPAMDAHLKVVSLQTPGNGYLLLLQDITEEKRIEDQFLITEKMAAFGRLSAGLAHEIGTPLNVISGRAELIESIHSDVQTVKHISVIDQQIKRISSIIQQLLAQVSEDLPAKRTFLLNDCVRRALEHLKPNLEQKGVDVNVNLADDLPKLVGFPDQWEQVLIHLVLNAIDAIENQDGLIQISTRKSEDQIELAVADNGCGISESNLTRIFDPFFTTKEFGKGTGLGLSVTASVARSAGGRVQVESRVGQGTMFLIFLPMN